MNFQLSQLQHTVSLGVMKMLQATQIAQATVMIEDMGKMQAAVEAPHPTLGKQLDVSV
ncbi:polyribonucleotide nucleotidyltransferase [Brevibacillus sp. B_LB10_24]|uniref:polyribonucleotide nucleotidyltransferase n=1 Tax=Brevibacillus sp. B_LB10_24 TaxID=3380645 RepID=UPI0038BD66F8